MKMDQGAFRGGEERGRVDGNAARGFGCLIPKCTAFRATGVAPIVLFDNDFACTVENKDAVDHFVVARQRTGMRMR